MVNNARYTFAGDVYATGRLPFVVDGNSRQWLDAIDRIASAAPEHVVPGHGRVSDNVERDVQLTRRYIEYLQASGYLEPEIEDLELEDLQGVHGLRALRVTINMRKGSVEGNGSGPEGVEEGIRAVQNQAVS